MRREDLSRASGTREVTDRLTPTPPIHQTPPSPWDLKAEIYGKILDWNKKTTGRYGAYRANQSAEFLCSGCSRAESKETGLEGRDVKRQRNREEEEEGGKGDSWSQTACQKQEQSPATNATFLQVRQSDASGNSSFLPGLEEALLTHSLSLTALTTSPAEPRN